MSVLRFGPFLFGVVATWRVSAMERPPIPELLVFWNSDKALHLLAYAIITSLALFAVHGRRHAAIAAVFMGVLAGCVDELHQRFVPGRSSSVLDLGADALGAAICIVAWLRIEKVRSRAAPQPS